MDKKEIKIRVTEEEYAKIKAKADAKGMSVKAYSERAVMQRRDRKKEAVDIFKLLAVIEHHDNELECLNETLGKLLEEQSEDSVAVAAVLEEMAVLTMKLEREFTQLMVALDEHFEGQI